MTASDSPASNRALWNANIHYHALVLAALPHDARRVLDVGCGDGILSAQLIDAGVRHVVGIDTDAGVLGRARERHRGKQVEWVRGDVLTVPFEPGSFDAVMSIATLHQIGDEKGLMRFAELVRPGGVVAAIGLAAGEWRDLPYMALAYGAGIALRLVRGYWAHSAPITWPPPNTYREVKRISTRVLPGSRYRRHLLGRYSVIWSKPATG